MQNIMTYIKGHKHCAWLNGALPVLGWKPSHSPVIMALLAMREGRGLPPAHLPPDPSPG